MVKLQKKIALYLETNLSVAFKRWYNIHHGFYRDGWIGGRGRSPLSLAPNAT